MEYTYQKGFLLPISPIDNRLVHAVPADHKDESDLSPWHPADLD